MDIYLTALIILLLIFLMWLSSCFFGAPFQPSSDKALKEILELSGIENQKTDKKLKIADLGSGNGKIVIEFAKRGAKLNRRIEAHGFEINPLLVLWSRARIKKLGLQKNVFIHWKNFFRQNFSDFDIVTSFQIVYVMPELEEKFRKELKKGAKVISNTWRFPLWKPKKRLGDVYLYVK